MQQKKIIKLILVLLICVPVILFIRTLLFLGIFSFGNLFNEKEIITDYHEYNKNYYIEKYKGDLDSNLSIFPDKITSNMKNISFESNLIVGMLDTDGYIFLQYELSDDEFTKEIERLSNISMTIRNFDNEVITKSILYDEDSYVYPAYITSDGSGHTYEYALINEDNNQIICLYVAYPKVEDFKYSMYLKKDLSFYKNVDSLNSFTIYKHSFDNGNTFIEFNDF